MQLDYKLSACPYLEPGGVGSRQNLQEMAEGAGVM